MKKLIVVIGIISLCVSCKQKTDAIPIVVETEPELSVAQKIANAHGFENWKNVTEIQFKFGQNRNWVWHPKSDDITLTTSKDTISYNRKSLDSISTKADRAFINDKFWLLIPFQLVWDEGTTISKPVKAKAPVSKSEMNKITLTYSDKGGYTPGDAYDIFYGDDFIIKEWAFRRGNKPEAGLVNTFENYQYFNGLKIALDHKKAEGDWNLQISNVKVTLN